LQTRRAQFDHRLRLGSQYLLSVARGFDEQEHASAVRKLVIVR
jgi:hypothetical protein